MAYETVRQLLDKMVQLHLQLKGVYAGLEEEVHRESVKMLLDYCRIQEDKLARTTAEFELDASPALLSTWFDFTPDLKRWEELAQVKIDAHAAVDEAASAVLKADQALIDLYREIKENAQANEVRELFENIIAAAEAARHRFAGQVREMAGT